MTKFKLVARKSELVKRAVTVFLAVGVLLTSTVLTSSPASAVGYPMPADMHPTKYATGKICVGSTLNPSYYPVGAIAQQWNNAVNVGGDEIWLDFSTNCAADNYLASRSMVVGTFSNPNAACLAFTNIYDRAAAGDGSAMYHWTNTVGVYINVGVPSCVSTAQRRSHQVAAGIGYALGLRVLTTTGYASRVMCTCSLDTVRSPDSASANRVWLIYYGHYGG